MKNYTYLAISFAILPLVAVAQEGEFNNIGDVLNWLLGLVNNYLIPLIISIALLAFLWTNTKSLANRDSLVNKAEAKTYLFWAVIALFVMVSIWGIVGILADAFGIKNVVPQLETGNGGGSGNTEQPCGPPRTDCEFGEGPIPPWEEGYTPFPTNPGR